MSFYTLASAIHLENSIASLTFLKVFRTMLFEMQHFGPALETKEKFCTFKNY